MGEIDLDQVVNNLSNVLGITASEGEERRAAYEEKIRDVYRSPIVEPLKKLKGRLDAESKERITIDESAEVKISDKTLVMRKELANLLNLTSDKEPLSVNKRNLIAKWIVEDWGGITPGKRLDDDLAAMLTKKNQSDASLTKCIDMAERVDVELEKGGEAVFDFKNRIASWSKYLAFKKPDKYAIYDARVIYSLNWLLFQSEAKQYFPFLSGRNAVMELLDYQVYLFLGKNGLHTESVKQALSVDKNKRRDNTIEQKDSKKTNNSYFSSGLIRSRKLFISNNEAFTKYCELLKRLSEELFSKEDQDRLSKTEMLLFAIADAEIAESVLEYISNLATGVTAKRHI